MNTEAQTQETRPDPGPAAEAIFEAKRRWHKAQARLPLREKVRILLEMQRRDLPLIARRRPLAPWEKPWDIEP